MFSSLMAVVPAGDNNSNGGKPRGQYGNHKPRPFTSREEMLLHTKDPRYSGKYDQQEESFQILVSECLGLTNAAMLGAGTGLLEAAMAEQPRRDWQDLGGDLEKDTSIYHSVEESQADMRSPRYKTDPYYRELVSRKIDRSTPNDPVTFPKHQAVRVNFLDPAAGEDYRDRLCLKWWRQQRWEHR